MRDRPQMELVGHDGNIFAIVGRAAGILRDNDMREDADEMVQNVKKCGSYDDALMVISEYVQTELSGEDHGILEADDICADTDFTFDTDGITAYIGTWFDVERRFGIRLKGDDSVDMYAAIQPETGNMTAEIVIKRAQEQKRERRSVRLFPCEQQLIGKEMESISKEISGMNLKELYAEWKAEYGEKQQKNSLTKEKKKHQHER